MSDFEKIIIPLIDSNIEKGDLSPEAGFVDSYTSDPDNPSGECELFLVYDDSIRTQESINTARKLSALSSKKKVYTKRVNGEPRIIYSFWIKLEAKKLYKQHSLLSDTQKQRILQFWSIYDGVFSVVTSGKLICKIEHNMPLADYVPAPV